jgi:ABC-type antimicrobial peptide transport system permease subunit
LRETLAMAMIGIVVGVPVSLAATRLIQHQLFGIPPYDGLSMGVALVVLVGVALAAGYLPAMRAARVGPLVALREE